MVRAASITLIPQSNSADFHIDRIHVVSSDPSDYPGLLIKRGSGKMQLETLYPRPFRAMLVRLVDVQAVEFSDPIDLTLQPGLNDAVTVAMHPAVSIRGRLGDEVPRPVVAGRVSAIALTRKDPLPNFDWTQWAPVDENGGFVIAGIPRSEKMQVIAVCEHFIARNGTEPIAKPAGADADPLGGLRAMFEVARDLTKTEDRPCTRPQVFGPDAEQPITIGMAPLVRCEISVVDPDGKPLPDIFVGGYANVLWWGDWGSQVYGRQLMRSTEWLTGTAIEEPWDSDSVRGFDVPFFDHSDENGAATVYLPPGKQTLFAEDKNEDYQLPVFLGSGSRNRQVTVRTGETLAVTLQLEPTGTETLGEYDKLAGVVFGCSTREGKQICTCPKFAKRWTNFRDAFARPTTHVIQRCWPKPLPSLPMPSTAPATFQKLRNGVPKPTQKKPSSNHASTLFRDAKQMFCTAAKKRYADSFFLVVERQSRTPVADAGVSRKILIVDYRPISILRSCAR